MDNEKPSDETLIDYFKKNNSFTFLGFDGQWNDCNHEEHNYKEFWTNGNKRIKMKINLNNKELHYVFDYLHKDIREVWGTEKTIKNIQSNGILRFIQENDELSWQYQLIDTNLSDYILANISIKNGDLEIALDCKTCSGYETIFLYDREIFLNQLKGYRLYLWDGLY